MQAAINASVFNPDTFSIPFYCPTGNCTVPGKYHSMAYCSKCEDITHEATYNDTDAPAEVTVTPPSGLMAQPGPASFTMRPANGSDLSIVELISTNIVDKSTCHNESSWLCRDHSAARCSLFLCTRTYSAVIDNRQLHEEELSRHSEFGPETDNLFISSLDMLCVASDQKQSLRDQGYRFNDTIEWLAHNVSFAPSNGDGSGWAYATGDDHKNDADLILQIVPLNTFIKNLLSLTPALAIILQPSLLGMSPRVVVLRPSQMV